MKVYTIYAYITKWDEPVAILLLTLQINLSKYFLRKDKVLIVKNGTILWKPAFDIASSVSEFSQKGRNRKTCDNIHVHTKCLQNLFKSVYIKVM